VKSLTQSIQRGWKGEETNKVDSKSCRERDHLLSKRYGPGKHYKKKGEEKVREGDYGEQGTEKLPSEA